VVLNSDAGCRFFLDESALNGMLDQMFA
jgi:hypothetical protein